MFGVSFALWSLSVPQTTTNTLTSGCLKLTYADADTTANPAINLSAQYPITDTTAASLKAYAFKITNGCSTAENFKIDLNVMSTSTLSADYIKYKIDTTATGGTAKLLKDATASTPYSNFGSSLTASSAKTLLSSSINGSATNTYYLRLWMADNTPLNASTQNKKFDAKIVVTATPK